MVSKLGQCAAIWVGSTVDGWKNRLLFLSLASITTHIPTGASHTVRLLGSKCVCPCTGVAEAERYADAHLKRPKTRTYIHYEKYGETEWGNFEWLSRLAPEASARK